MDLPPESPVRAYTPPQAAGIPENQSLFAEVRILT